MGFVGAIILFALIGILGFIGAKFFGFSLRASILFFGGFLAGIDFIEGFSYDITQNYSWAFMLAALLDRFLLSKPEK